MWLWNWLKERFWNGTPDPELQAFIDKTKIESDLRLRTHSDELQKKFCPEALNALVLKEKELNQKNLQTSTNQMIQESVLNFQKGFDKMKLSLAGGIENIKDIFSDSPEDIQKNIAQLKKSQINSIKAEWNLYIALISKISEKSWIDSRKEVEKINGLVQQWIEYINTVE